MTAQTIRQKNALRSLRPVAKDSTRDHAPWWLWALLFASVAIAVGAQI